MTRDPRSKPSGMWFGPVSQSFKHTTPFIRPRAYHGSLIHPDHTGLLDKVLDDC